MSEVMPTELRAKAMSLFLSINWGFNLLISLFTLSAINDLGGYSGSMTDDEQSNAQKNGVAYLYYIFAGFSLITIMFIHVYVPETKGKTPDDILAMTKHHTNSMSESKSPLLSLQGDEDVNTKFVEA
jgi:MFS transporter, SP family, major inositol transporter